MTAESAVLERLRQGLAELQISADPEQLESLRILASELERWSRRMNLTAHRSAEEIVGNLILGAAALGAQLPAIESLADIGSGAGFPGLPIAVLRRETRITLVEPRERRHHFQRAAVRAMKLQNVKMLLGRAEDSALQRPHGAAIAQAVARSDQALEWLEPWVAPDGFFLLPAAVESPPPNPEKGIVFNRLEYQVPCGGPSRTLWIGQRGPNVPRGTFAAEKKR